MKNLLLFILLSIFFLPITFGQDWVLFSNQGIEFYQKGDYQQAIDFLKKANIEAGKEFGKEHENYSISLNNLASVHQKLEHYLEAEKLFVELLAIEKKRLGQKDFEYGMALNNLAGLYYTVGKFPKAEPLFLQALAIDKEHYAEKPTHYAISLKNLARIYGKVGQYQQAKSLYLEAEAINKAEHFNANKWTDYNEFGMLAFDQADYQTALNQWEKALPEAEREFGKEHKNYVYALNNLALVYEYLERYQEVEKLYVEAIGISKKYFGEDDPSYGIALGNLAGLYKELGQYQKSKDLYIDALRRKKIIFGKNHPSVAKASNNLALVYQSLGDFSKAEKLFKNACLILKNKADRNEGEYATFLNTLATLYLRTNRFWEAEPLYLESKKIRKELFGEKNINYAYSLMGLGWLYRDMGRYKESEKMFLQAQEIFKVKLGENTGTYANLCTTLGGLYLLMDKDDESESLFLKAKEIWKQNLGEKHPSYGNILTSIAVLYQKQEKYPEAKKLLLEAEEIWESQNQKTFTTLFAYLGVLYQNTHEYSKAESYLLKAKELNKDFLGKKHIHYAQDLNVLAYLYEKMNNYSKSEALHKEVNQILFSQIEQNLEFLSEKEKSQYIHTLEADRILFNSFVLNFLTEKPHLTAQMYDNILFSKGLLFLSAKKTRSLIMDSQDEQIKKEYDNWTKKRQSLAHIYTLSIEERKKQDLNIEALENEINQIEKELNSKSKTFAKEQSSKQRYSWKDVKKRLKKGEAAVEITRIKHFQKDMTGKIKYLALIVKSNTGKYPEYVLLENGKELEKKYLKFYRNAVKYKIKDSKSYEQYWAQIATKLKGIKKVYLSADGVYHSLNLAALKNPKTTNYLHDELDIELLIGTKELVLPQNNLKSSNQAQLFGYPNYNKLIQQEDDLLLQQDSTKRFLNSETIVSLPATKVEVTGIASILKKAGLSAEVHLDNRATEDKIKNLKQPSILHIATHGFFLEDVKSQADKNGKLMGISHEKVVENPLLRSGLLFAGAKQAINQGGAGVLTAYEAANLKLEGTELLVLSACQTGLGEIKNGEGVYGLQRAFQTAGAETILMSLWSVSDQVTQELMTQFYQNWLLKKQTKRKAFKNAQNTIKKSYPEPYFWAAFVMIGE